MRSPIRGRRPGRSTALGLVLILAAIASTIAACRGSAAAPISGGGAAAAPAAAASAPAGPAGNGNGSGGETGGAASGSGDGSGAQSGSGDQVAIIDDAKIVRTGSLQMTVTDVTQSLTGARDAIRSLGGYIGASQQQRDGETVVATVTYRIPVARWEDALTALRGLGTEIGEKTDSVEVTGDIVDLGARITNLKASEVALVGYAEKAPQVSDLLEIQARLTDTRGQIERLTAQEQQLQDQAAYATLNVTFGTEAVAVTTWIPVEPVPTTPTRFPCRLTGSSGQRAVMYQSPSNVSRPGKGGGLGAERFPTARTRKRASYSPRSVATRQRSRCSS